jgi:hypothetical protein
MHDAVRAFATGLIDYAGLFPPAELPLDQALPKDLRYRGESDAWMLGRFICPAARLTEILRLEPSVRTDARFRVSALGRGGADRDAFQSGLREDLEAIASFHREAGRSDIVEIFEVRVPAEAARGDAGVWRETLDRTHEAIAETGLIDLRLYLESPGPDPAAADLARAAEAFARSTVETGRTTGLKLRCGGVTPDAFPKIETVARALAACREQGVSFKATAGLHHPLRSFRSEVGTKMHGFVNVFGAALLAHAHALSAEQIVPILECEEAAAFRWRDDGFTWRDLLVSTEEIRRLRGGLVTSFGSCSFDEPRDDLRSLGWLD